MRRLFTARGLTGILLPLAPPALVLVERALAVAHGAFGQHAVAVAQVTLLLVPALKAVSLVHHKARALEERGLRMQSSVLEAFEARHWRSEA